MRKCCVTCISRPLLILLTTEKIWMEEKDFRVDIPNIFKTEEGAFFRECISCGIDVIGSGEPYMIERAIKKYKTWGIENAIFEYAICLKCAEKMRLALSKESLQRIEKHFMENANWAAKLRLLRQEVMPNVEDFVHDCIFSGQKRSDEALEEYQVFAHCIGDKLVLDKPPFMISHAAADAMGELLSAQTREELDRFIDDNFGLPPEWKKALKDRDFILV